MAYSNTGITPLNGIQHQEKQKELLSFEEEGRTLSIEELQDLGDAALGLRVHVTAKDGSFIGVINLILPDCRRLALEKACNAKTGKKKMGLVMVFFHNIQTIMIIGEDKEARQRLLQDLYCEDQRGKQLLMKKLVPIHLADKEKDNLVDEDVLLGRVAPKGNCFGQSPSHEENENVELPTPPRIPRPSKWCIIDNLNESFQKALKFVQTENVVALGCEGPKLGRSGSLAWLSLATSSHIFLFDIAKLGKEAFTQGLAEILTESSIMKVMHDCRALEDLLHHQHGINLSNVFDTQACEIYVYMLNHRGAVPCYVSSLPSLLVRYLGLSPQHLFFSHVREECAESDESVWLERPLPSRLCEGLAQGVMYLRELRLALLDLVLVDLAQLTSIYVSSLRDKDSTTLHRLEPHVVPMEIQNLGRRSVSNSINVFDPFVSFSRSANKIPLNDKK
ncbi:unnamed protein product [Meganyctiphanes norvegica]|uniref:3'-5' exonuclease domain-containing protein n=1 Tax=Meganyctiphanes norvegica TaxID=48144 RepID=A0AAV2SIW0_MEGNR